MTARVYTLPGGRIMFSARTHTWGTDELRHAVADRSLRCVVNLWHTSDPRASALVDEYHLMPTADGQLRDSVLDVARRASEVAHKSLLADSGSSVLVHCWGGKNRSGLVAAMTYMRLNRSPGLEAYDAVKAARRGALSNPHFAKWLQEASYDDL